MSEETRSERHRREVEAQVAAGWPTPEQLETRAERHRREVDDLLASGRFVCDPADRPEIPPEVRARARAAIARSGR